KQESLEPIPIALERGRPFGSERAVRRRRRTLAAEIPPGHGDRPVHEVAEVICQVSVVSPNEGIPRHLCIAIERDLAEGDVARAVGPERRDNVGRIEEVSATLAHPLATLRE